VAAHTPEACWPGAGWTALPEHTARLALPLGAGATVAAAERRAFLNRDEPHTVWFWHLVGGRPLRPFEPRSWREQLRVFFEHGIAREEPQAFVRLSTNGAWEELAADPFVHGVVTGLAPFGLPVEAPPGAPAAAP
jgi:hypothetical protein